VQIALRTSIEAGVPVVHVSGSLGAAGVPLLRNAVAVSPRPAIVDLRELVAASAEGIAALRALHDSGHRMRNASPYMTLRLRETEDIDEPPEGPGAREAPREEDETT